MPTAGPAAPSLAQMGPEQTPEGPMMPLPPEAEMEPLPPPSDSPLVSRMLMREPDEEAVNKFAAMLDAKSAA